jgi:hypothetical protein
LVPNDGNDADDDNDTARNGLDDVSNDGVRLDINGDDGNTVDDDCVNDTDANEEEPRRLADATDTLDGIDDEDDEEGRNGNVNRNACSTSR